MMPSVRKPLLKLHRWVSLCVAALWLFQALTGMFIAFHWQIGNALLPGAAKPIDIAAIDRTVRALTPEGSGKQIGSIWTSADGSDRFDLYLDDSRSGESRTIRVNGGGDILRDRPDSAQFEQGAWIGTIVLLHHNLLAGDTGSWIIGLSGILLITNIIGGLILAWPRRGTIRAVLLPRRSGAPVARFYAWHRALGLWAAPPALILVLAGTLMVFSGGLTSVLDAPGREIANQPWRGTPAIGMPAAVKTAQDLYPTAALSGISYPTPDNAAWRVRLSQPGEPARTYGNTTVFVDANDGKVIGNFDAMNPPPSRGFIDSLFPLHTGDMFGVIGRIGAIAIALWLSTMTILGVLLWARRKR
jgi:uncharacterized iron-regulated membrane protein